MKKLFTLSIAIFCTVAINAQMSGSGNGFAETFTYDNGFVFEEGLYPGIWAEWPDGAVIEDGKLKWELPNDEGGEAAIGMWELEMDLTGNTDILFKYQFPEGAEFGIWIEDNAGGGGEIFPEDFQLGLSELMDYTFDASAIPDVDLSDVAEIWIMSVAEAGTFYLDDLVIGDGSLTGISSKVVKSTLQVYPNPASSAFTIGVDAESVSILNITGQKVFSVQNYQKGSLIDVNELKEGIYLINADDRTAKLMVK